MQKQNINKKLKLIKCFMSDWLKLTTNCCWAHSRAGPSKNRRMPLKHGEHTVFFSKRRKNSSLCAHHMAAWFELCEGDMYL